MNKVLSIGEEVPSKLVTNESIDSKISLLDWDVIIISPSTYSFYDSYENYCGKPCLTDNESFQLKESLDHWKREIKTAINSGKIVIYLLKEIEEVYIATGEKQYSGTGRNQSTTRMVSMVSNYSATHYDLSPVNSSGKLMTLENTSHFFKEYWSIFEKHTEYKVLLNNKEIIPILKTKSGNKIVGGYFHNNQTNGYILFLPFVNFNQKGFVSKREDKLFWTDKAFQFGEMFISSILKLSKQLISASNITPAPSWVDNSEYLLQTESILRKEIIEFEKTKEEIENNIIAKKEQLISEVEIKGLLFEQGKPLEKSIIKALSILGFSTSQYKQNDSEFDVVFESPEGRMLGEAEGKDAKPISIEKLRQLEMNINEDFSRDEISQIAKGVLFGNAYRLENPSNRKCFFTDKCIISANRSNIALFSTVDLFKISQYFINNHNDSLLPEIRKHIFESVGIIDFKKFSSALKFNKEINVENTNTAPNETVEKVR